jgi:anti-anti-sigma factor
MVDFNVSVEKFDRFAVIRSQGYINNLGGEEIARECRDVMKSGITDLILNLKESTVVNSIGISILIEIIEEILKKEGRLAFSDLTPTVAKTFKIMGLLQFAEYFESEQVAIQAFNGNSGK